MRSRSLRTSKQRIVWGLPSAQALTRTRLPTTRRTPQREVQANEATQGMANEMAAANIKRVENLDNIVRHAAD